jgi:hypothetical protein
MRHLPGVEGWLEKGVRGPCTTTTSSCNALIGVEPPAREKKLSWDSYHEWGNILVRSIWSFLKIQRKNCRSQELFFDLTSCLIGKLQWWSSGQIQHTRKQSCWAHQMQLERIALTTGHNKLRLLHHHPFTCAIRSGLPYLLWLWKIVLSFSSIQVVIQFSDIDSRVLLLSPEDSWLSSGATTTYNHIQ